MNRGVRRLGLPLSALLMACSPTPGPVAASTSGPATASAGSAGSAGEAAPSATAPTATPDCGQPSTSERLTIQRGVPQRAADGLEARFGGASHDHYDDGHSELLLDLSFRDGGETTSWLPDARDDRWHRLLGRCMRVVEATEDQVTLDVASAAPQAAPSSAAPPGSCLEALQRGSPLQPSGTLIVCAAEHDDAVRDLFNRAAGSEVGLVPPGCRLERICGHLAGVDCDAAVDGPYDYYDMRSWNVVAQCGGACMAGRCKNCPPKDMTCPTY